MSILQRQAEDNAEIYTYQLKRDHSGLSVIQEESDTDGPNLAQRMNSQSLGLRRPQYDAALMQMPIRTLSFIPAPLEGSVGHDDSSRYFPSMVPKPGQPRVRQFDEARQRQAANPLPVMPSNAVTSLPEGPTTSFVQPEVPMPLPFVQPQNRAPEPTPPPPLSATVSRSSTKKGKKVAPRPSPQMFAREAFVPYQNMGSGSRAQPFIPPTRELPQPTPKTRGSSIRSRDNRQRRSDSPDRSVAPRSEMSILQRQAEDKAGSYKPSNYHMLKLNYPILSVIHRQGTDEGRPFAPRMNTGSQHYIVGAPSQDDIPQHYMGAHECTWFQEDSASPHDANPPQDNGVRHSGSQVYIGSQRHDVPQQYQYDMTRHYMSIDEHLFFERCTRSQQHSMPQPYAGWEGTKQPESSEPRSPFVLTRDYTPASSPYVPPANLGTGNTHSSRPSSRNWSNRRATVSEHTSPVVTLSPTTRHPMLVGIMVKKKAFFPKPEAVAFPSPQVKSYPSGGGYDGYEPPRQPMYAGYRTPSPSSQPLPVGMMSETPWTHAPQEFQPPAARKSASVITRTTTSGYDLKSPHTIFESISSDESSIYNPNSPDEHFQSLNGASPGPQFAGLPESEDDEEEPKPFIPQPTGASSSGFVPSGVPHPTGASSSGFVPPGVPMSSFVPGIQRVRDTVQSMMPSFTGDRQAPRKTELVMSNTPRTSVHSITDEDEPMVVPVAPPREPIPPVISNFTGYRPAPRKSESATSVSPRVSVHSITDEDEPMAVPVTREPMPPPQSVMLDFTGYRPSPRRSELVMSMSPRVSVHSITDEDEPMVVPVAPPREPIPPPQSVMPNFTRYRPAPRKSESVISVSPRVSVHSITDEDEPMAVPVTREPMPPPQSVMPDFTGYRPAPRRSELVMSMSPRISVHSITDEDEP